MYWVGARDGKVRPCLVISVSRRNELASDVVIIPGSSQLRFGPWHVPLRKGEAGLRKATVLRCEEPLTVAKERLRERIGGPLSPARLAEVERALASALGFGGDVE